MIYNYVLFEEIGSLDPVGCCSERPLLGLMHLLVDCLSAGLFWDCCAIALAVFRLVWGSTFDGLGIFGGSFCDCVGIAL